MKIQGWRKVLERRFTDRDGLFQGEKKNKNKGQKVDKDRKLGRKFVELKFKER